MTNKQAKKQRAHEVEQVFAAVIGGAGFAFALVLFIIPAGVDLLIQLGS